MKLIFLDARWVHSIKRKNIFKFVLFLIIHFLSSFVYCRRIDFKVNICCPFLWHSDTLYMALSIYNSIIPPSIEFKPNITNIGKKNCGWGENIYWSAKRAKSSIVVFFCFLKIFTFFFSSLFLSLKGITTNRIWTTRFNRENTLSIYSCSWYYSHALFTSNT